MIKIPGYKIHREIDSSDYCRSYSAIQLSTGKTMVVSIFSHSATEYASFKSFFNDIDTKIAKKVFGVIAPIKEFIKTQNHTYIISDLLSNSCQQVYKDKEADVESLLEQIYKIALSINLYHQVGFYHGGISLDNIFHDGDNILTLGLAAFNQNFSNFDNETENDLNKESYQAPEKEISQSKSRDYYALGVVLYELIFKQKPFIAISKVELDQLKKEAVIIIPNPNYDHLKPLFSALLNPNPEKRISSADEFKHVSLLSNIHLKNISFHIKTLGKANSEPEFLVEETINTSAIPKYAYILSSILIASIAIGFYLFSTSNKEKRKTIQVHAEQLIKKKPESSTSLVSADTNNSEFDSLIPAAKDALANKKKEASLMSINQALIIKPNNKKALFIKPAIEDELKINAIIQQANQQILNGNLISPKNDNAIATYNKLQDILPKGDTRAQRGIEKISNTYHRLALKQYNLKKPELAKSILNKALIALPKDKQLNQLSRLLKKDEANQQARLKQAEQKKFQERQQQEVLQVKEEAGLIATIENQKLRDIEVKRQKQTIKDFQIQKEKHRQQQLTNLFQEAQHSLANNQLSLQSIDKVVDHLHSLEFLSVSTAKSNQLRKQIDEAYLSLAEYQVSNNQYTLAKNTINKGLKINPKNQNLLVLNNTINSLESKQKTDDKKSSQTTEVKPKEKDLPIFGTF